MCCSIISLGSKMKYDFQDVFSLAHSRPTTIHILNNIFLSLWPDNTLLLGWGCCSSGSHSVWWLHLRFTLRSHSYVSLDPSTALQFIPCNIHFVKFNPTFLSLSRSFLVMILWSPIFAKLPSIQSTRNLIYLFISTSVKTHWWKEWHIGERAL